ncbi:glutamine cyclotransferase [Flavobacterium akiainvivens]|uniref:Glutamine cyclotransferase n=1 Tax=Flavobacterium akiainvivens TaxID=1202724 RepID=A0A0M9VHU8_9FLAO|nr:glutaminyl-peptide cyclotransferase [Flavobacterium akiainvivens]KOS05939.1 glutamine cyclotransferase [Flavobacterium akiainvivens]SFQ53444.1 Glutamine cyclotransferase [Flavobacterium akiainvivens]
MKAYNFLAAIALAASFTSCNKEIIFSIDPAGLKGQYRNGESVTLNVKEENNAAQSTSVEYFIDDKKAGTAQGTAAYSLKLDGLRLGYHNIKAVVSYDGETAQTEEVRIELVSPITPKIITDYEIINTYPHDITSYTQGLEFYRDTLFEGTGQYKESKLRKTDYKTGKVYSEVALEGKYFGEGITIFNNKVYQLTWRENTGFIYNADNLKKEKDFTYFQPVQGWGLMHDDKYLYQSDGTERIFKLDPQTLKEVDHINVYTQTNKIEALNELEWINGKIYANVYQQDAVAIIDPATGNIEAVIDFSALKTKVTQHPELDVLNGIAWNPKTNSLFVTGKNWDKMFEIRIR